MDLKSFFLPKLTKLYLLRVVLVALCAWLLFGYILRPAIIKGESMMPTYGSFSVNICWLPAYWFAEPAVGDIVTVRYVDNRTMLLKRIVALEDDTVEFREGKLMVNGTVCEQPWNSLTECNWNLPPRVVEKGCVYVVGDNRTMNIDDQIFGQVEKSRLAGKPLW